MKKKKKEIKELVATMFADQRHPIAQDTPTGAISNLLMGRIRVC